MQVQFSPPRPPYGTYDEVTRFPQIANSKGPPVRALDPPGLGQSPAFLVRMPARGMDADQKMMLEEMIQTRKEAKMWQLDSRRLQEETLGRLMALEDRLQVLEPPSLQSSQPGRGTSSRPNQAVGR